jgi:hypothetical protein
MVSDAECHNDFADTADKRSLIFFCDIIFVWVREAFADCCTRNVKSGLWFEVGIWNQRIIND